MTRQLLPCSLMVALVMVAVGAYALAGIAEYRTDRTLHGLTIPQAAQTDDLTRILRHPMVSIASDSGLNTFGEGVPHPSGYGNAARVPGRYLRDERVISLEEAVRKMTSLPADQLSFLVNGVPVVKDGTQTDARPGYILRHTAP